MLRHDTDQSTTRIDEIWKILPSLRASAASAHPADSSSQKAAQQLIAEAKQKIIPPIQLSTVQDAGQAFVQASQSAPKAWDTALDFINYRSTLISIQSEKSAPTPTDADFGTNYQLSRVLGKPVAKMGQITPQAVPQDKAARVEDLSYPPQQEKENGIGTFVISDGAFKLDQMHLRHVVLTGVEVHYSGGPALLEDVVFVNCQFVMDNVPPARQLASSILSSERVTIKLI